MAFFCTKTGARIVAPGVSIAAGGDVREYVEPAVEPLAKPPTPPKPERAVPPKPPKPEPAKPPKPEPKSVEPVKPVVLDPAPVAPVEEPPTDHTGTADAAPVDLTASPTTEP